MPGGRDLHRQFRGALGVAVFAGAAGAVRGRGSLALVPPVVAIHRRSKQLPKLDRLLVVGSLFLRAFKGGSEARSYEGVLTLKASGIG